MGGLQIMLDKGEENAWFASNFIRFFGAMFVIGIIGLIWWEWNNKAPIMNIKLFKYKNFAICCLLMMALVGGVLNASTVLQPQFMQQLLGYTATIAGEALTGGGHRPGRRHATRRHRHRQVCRPQSGSRSASPSSPSPSGGTPVTINLGLSFGYNAFLRVILMLPIPFCFISITNAAYVGLPREASNQVSGIINFVRNVGGSIFIALTGAEVTNRSLFHQARLQNSMQPGSDGYVAALNGMKGAFSSITGNPADATMMANASIYQQLQAQAATQAYQDIFRLLCYMSIAMVGFAFLLSKNKPGQGAPAGEAVH